MEKLRLKDIIQKHSDRSKLRITLAETRSFITELNPWVSTPKNFPNDYPDSAQLEKLSPEEMSQLFIFLYIDASINERNDIKYLRLLQLAKFNIDNFLKNDNI